MGDIAYCVEVRPRFGHFNSTSLLAISEVRLARWVIHRHPIHDEPVIMEAWHSRWCCHTPDAVGSLGHWKWSGTQTVTAGDLHAVRDRKSTRLNSSHSQISYAVFCLKKKKPGHESRVLV